MANEKDVSTHDHHERGVTMGNPTSNAVYGMGFLGALVNFIIHATSFSDILLGILKAVFWPAVLIYNLLEFLKL